MLPGESDTQPEDSLVAKLRGRVLRRTLLLVTDEDSAAKPANGLPGPVIVRRRPRRYGRALRINRPSPARTWSRRP